MHPNLLLILCLVFAGCATGRNTQSSNPTAAVDAPLPPLDPATRNEQAQSLIANSLRNPEFRLSLDKPVNDTYVAGRDLPHVNCERVLLGLTPTVYLGCVLTARRKDGSPWTMFTIERDVPHRIKFDQGSTAECSIWSLVDTLSTSRHPAMGKVKVVSGAGYVTIAAFGDTGQVSDAIHVRVKFPPE